MDTEDLLRLAAHLEDHGLCATTNGAGNRPHVMNPRIDMRTAGTVATGDCHVTTFDYEIGKDGCERACAECSAVRALRRPCHRHLYAVHGARMTAVMRAKNRPTGSRKRYTSAPRERRANVRRTRSI
ncbi:hypothetical protein [Streptomyces sp. NPDC055060]